MGAPEILWFLSDPGVASEGEIVEMESQVSASQDTDAWRVAMLRNDISESIFNHTFAPLSAGEEPIIPDDFTSVDKITFQMPGHDVSLTMFMYFWNGDTWVFTQDKGHTVTLQSPGAEFNIRSLDASKTQERMGELLNIKADAVLENIGTDGGRGCVRFTLTDSPAQEKCTFLSPGEQETLTSKWFKEAGDWEVCVELI